MFGIMSPFLRGYDINLQYIVVLHSIYLQLLNHNYIMQNFDIAETTFPIPRRIPAMRIAGLQLQHEACAIHRDRTIERRTLRS